MTTVRRRLAELVSAASDDLITADEALRATVPLTALGMSSLAQMRLIDAIEAEFGVQIDLAGDGVDLLDDLDALTAFLDVSDPATP
jgi:acyl carrier protein